MNAETSYPVKKLVNLTEEQGARISSFRFDQRISSENEAIRQLIELGLEAGKAVTADQLIAFCRDQQRSDLAQLIESLVFESKNRSDLPLLHSFPLTTDRT
jgi:hypothetical protein